MTPAFSRQLKKTLAEIDAAGLGKHERVLSTAQGASIEVGGRRLLNFCSNNYLGLANDPQMVRAARAALDRWGYGLASVRFICGTQDIHRSLEKKLAAFLGVEDAILYSSCFDANGGVFETLLSAEDAIISDELNHASLIDGIRLCKAQRLRYRNGELSDLEAKLREARGLKARFKLIVTDGVFSMDGTIAPLKEICDLADRHNAMVLVDDSHAVGVLGSGGRGTHEHCGVKGRVDILTGTFGKALGGASGGYVAGWKEIIDLLRQRSRPYLFSNSLAPAIAAASVTALDLADRSAGRRHRLEVNARHFRAGLSKAGFSLKPGVHPIVPVMFGEAALAKKFAARLFQKGVYVVAFSYPVVPHGAARIRVQLSAAHRRADLDFALDAFAVTKREFGI